MLNAYLKRYGYETQYNIFFNNLDYCCTERIIAPGDMVSVAGKVEWKSATNRGLPEGPEIVPCITAIDKETPLFLSNDPSTVRL